MVMVMVMDNDEFIGSCPLCGHGLHRVGHGVVECEEGDYAVLETTFDLIWDEYSPRILKEESGAADAILRQLRLVNTKGIQLKSEQDED